MQLLPPPAASQCFLLQDLCGVCARAAAGGDPGLKMALWAPLAPPGINSNVLLGENPLICTSTCYLSNPRGKFAP